MAEYRTVARPYARAVFAHASAQQKLTEWQQVLEALVVIVQSLKSLNLVGNPTLTEAQLVECCVSTLEAVLPNIDASVAAFVRLVIAEKRLLVIPAVAELYHQLVVSCQQIVEVTITSADVLSDTQRQQLIAALAERFKQQVVATYHEDPQLIGGFTVKSGNWVFDGSIRSKLQRLAERVI